MDDANDGSFRLPLAALLLLIAALGMVDLALDAPETWWSVHVLYETALILAALSTAAWLWVGRRRAERDSARLRRLVAERQAERDAWQASAEESLAGLAQAIDRQLDAWGLTPTEREIVFQILRGRSHKQIAADTGRSERTVRQHAAAAYRKAGLGSRAELAGYFLIGLPFPTAGRRGT